MSPSANGDGPVRFDPHVHTAASHDANATVDDVLAAAERADLDAIAVTDHDAIEGALRAVDRAPSDLLVIPGVEVSTADGHLLALDVRERPPAGEPLVDTVERVRDAGGLAVVPHPFQVSRHGVRKGALADCDAVETYNAWAMTGVQNRRADAFAAREGYPRLGASDAHSAANVGRAYTAVEMRRCHDLTADALLGSIRAGRARPVGESVPIRSFARKYARILGGRTAAAVPAWRSRPDT